MGDKSLKLQFPTLFSIVKFVNTIVNDSLSLVCGKLSLARSWMRLPSTTGKLLDFCGLQTWIYTVFISSSMGDFCGLQTLIDIVPISSSKGKWTWVKDHNEDVLVKMVRQHISMAKGFINSDGLFP